MPWQWQTGSVLMMWEWRRRRGGWDSQVKRHKIVQQAHVIYLVRPLFVLFRERIEDFPNCRAPEVFYQVYSPPYVTH